MTEQRLEYIASDFDLYGDLPMDQIHELLTFAKAAMKENARLREESAAVIASAYNEGFHAHRCVGGHPLDLFKTSNARRAIGDLLEASQ